MKKQSEAITEYPAKTECDGFCDDCFYYRHVTESTKCCNYIFVTGHKRPCDPGTGCTVRELRNPKWNTRKDGKKDG